MVKPSLDQTSHACVEKSNPKPNAKRSQFKHEPVVVTTCPHSDQPATTIEFPSSLTRTWIVCDVLKEQESFVNLVRSNGIDCERILSSKCITENIAVLITELIADPPQLVWIAIPKNYSSNPELHAQFANVRLLIYQQLQNGGKIAVE